MTVSLGSLLPRMKTPFLLFFSHTVTDESYGINIGKIQSDEFLNPMNALGTNVMAYASWNVATLIGAIIGKFIYIDLKYLEGALPIMFVALLATQLKDKKHLLYAILSVGLTLIFMSFLSDKWPFLVTALIIPSIATLYELWRVR